MKPNTKQEVKPLQQFGVTAFYNDRALMQRIVMAPDIDHVGKLFFEIFAMEAHHQAGVDPNQKGNEIFLRQLTLSIAPVVVQFEVHNQGYTQ